MPDVNQTAQGSTLAIKTGSMCLIEEEDQGRRSAGAIRVVMVNVVSRRVAIDTGDQWRALAGMIRRPVIAHLAPKSFGEYGFVCLDRIVWLAAAIACAYTC